MIKVNKNILICSLYLIVSLDSISQEIVGIYPYQKGYFGLQKDDIIKNKIKRVKQLSIEYDSVNNFSEQWSTEDFYDKEGKIIKTISDEYETKTFEYNKNGHIISIKEIGGCNGNSEEKYIYKYDNKKNIIQEEHIEDWGHSLRKYKYDNANNETNIQHFEIDSNNVSLLISVYEMKYDSLNRNTLLIDDDLTDINLDESIEYKYDSLSRIVEEIHYTSAAKTPTITQKYKYNIKNRIIEAKSQSDIYTFLTNFIYSEQDKLIRILSSNIDNGKTDNDLTEIFYNENGLESFSITKRIKSTAITTYEYEFYK